MFVGLKEACGEVLCVRCLGICVHSTYVVDFDSGLSVKIVLTILRLMHDVFSRWIDLRLWRMDVEFFESIT